MPQGQPPPDPSPAPSPSLSSSTSAVFAVRLPPFSWQLCTSCGRSRFLSLWQCKKNPTINVINHQVGDASFPSNTLQWDESWSTQGMAVAPGPLWLHYISDILNHCFSVFVTLKKMLIHKLFLVKWECFMIRFATSAGARLSGTLSTSMYIYRVSMFVSRCNSLYS